MDYRDLGLLHRFEFVRTDGQSEDPEARIFALRYDRDDYWGAAARRALLAFCESVEERYEPFAADLRREILAIEARHNADRRI